MSPSRVPLVIAALLLASPATALQPLEEFIFAARTRNPDAQQALANVSVQTAQADVALGRQLPGVSAQANYARNQYQTQFQVPTIGLVTIQPYNSWTGNVTLGVPLIDLASFARIASARTKAESAALSYESALLGVEGRTAQDYYQLQANLALASVAEKYVEVSQENLRITQAKLNAGAATRLELDRSMADVESQVQQLASARLQVSLSARDLQSTTSLVPDLSGGIELSDDLHAEADLSVFEPELPNVPSVRAAVAATRAAYQQADAWRLALLPTLSGTFTENGTNAPGFQPSRWYWQAGLGLSWSFDLTTVANIRAGDASAAVSQAQELKATLAAGDAIHQYWNTVLAGIARSRSARAGREAAVHASEQARVQYVAGTATQLDLLQAQRDAFAAEVTRIENDANLLNARAQLQLSAGRSLAP